MQYKDSEYNKELYKTEIDKELYENEADKELMGTDLGYDEDLVEFGEHSNNVGEEPENYESESNHFRR